MASKQDSRGHSVPLQRKQCPECSVYFEGTGRAVFCTPKHKASFHGRNQARGQVMVPLVLAWRAGRGQKAVAKQALRELARLSDAWNAEDRAAGRLPQSAYAGAKLANGWTAVDYAFG